MYLSGASAEAAACDATVIPVVSGQPDWTALDQLTTLFVKAHGRGPDHHRDHAPGDGRDRDGRDNGRDRDGRDNGRDRDGRDNGRGRDRDGQAEPAGISPALRQRLPAPCWT